MDSLYAQQSQNQSQYSSPLYMQPVYPQQQYPVYGIVPPTWTPSPTPYFETPLVRVIAQTQTYFTTFTPHAPKFKKTSTNTCI